MRRVDDRPSPPDPLSQGGGGGRSFADVLHTLAAPHLAGLDRPTSAAEPLAPFDYSLELRIKNEALRRFWDERRLAGRPESILASPRPRSYRTTSKRRAVLRGSNLALVVGDRGAGGVARGVQPSALEPPEHAALYEMLYGKLIEPAFRPLTSHLNYLIVRGSYTERALIFNVDRFDAAIVRKIKLLADHLRKVPQPPVAVFAYLDPNRSEYYLESQRPTDVLSYRRIYGPEHLAVSFGANRFRFSPLSFSQINESAVPSMMNLVREMLVPGERLLDLYCGYGLFSHFLARDFREVLGVDAEGPSIEAASSNTRLHPEGGRRRFVARRITASAIDELLGGGANPDAVLLDPPRQGPLPGVAGAIAARRPATVLHVFCGVDQIPVSLRDWQAAGYRVERIAAVDLFPGTTNLEVLVQLTRRPYHDRRHSTGMRGSGR